MTSNISASHTTLDATAPASAHGQRTDKILAGLLKGSISREALKQAIIAGNVHVCDSETSDERPVGGPREPAVGGALYRVTLPEKEAGPDVPERILPLDILFEDEHLLLVHKQAGVTVHPGAGTGDDTLTHALIQRYGDHLPGDPDRPGIVHRLDRDTSGVMVVAKTEATRLALTEMIAERALQRIYHAICHKIPVPPAGFIDAPLARHPVKRKEMHVPRAGAEGTRIKESRTRYRLLSTLYDGFFSLIECKLETGRTHQIRVHMAHIGHPVAGDTVYNRFQIPVKLPDDVSALFKALRGQALHAHSLGFVHPITGEDVYAEAPYPDDMARIIAASRNPS